MQANGDYYWYCFAHRLEDYKLPKPELKDQLAFDLVTASDGMKTFQRLVDSSRPWKDCYEAYIIAQSPNADGGVGGENWRFAVEKIIGPPIEDHIVGSVIRKLRTSGDIEGTGVWRRPRDRKSKSSPKEILRRTSRR
jgi:hypothetical protein